jgi:hypothetical protein
VISDQEHEQTERKERKEPGETRVCTVQGLYMKTSATCICKYNQNFSQTLLGMFAPLWLKTLPVDYSVVNG